MPSIDRLKELVNNCSGKWTTVNGVYGMLVTGPSGGQIFLPAAGCRIRDGLSGAGFDGRYWLSTYEPESLCDSTSAHSLIFFSYLWTGATATVTAVSLCALSARSPRISILTQEQ